MRPLIAAVLMIACFALTACTDSDKRSVDSRFNGAYGGVIGGSAP